ncbi:MAG: hypothetical protein V8R64_06140 [Thomasclavelia sp.]
MTLPTYLFDYLSRTIRILIETACDCFEKGMKSHTENITHDEFP